MSLIGERAWVDGRIVAREIAAPSVASSTFHMGTGVFDGIMAYWNRDHWNLHLGRQHLARFALGCARMRLALRWSVSELEAGVHELLDTCRRTDHYIRPIAFRGAPEIRLVPAQRLPITACVLTVQAERNAHASASCVLSSVQRVSSRAIPVAWKVCGAYANSFLAQIDAIERGYDTALLLDRHGHVSEAAVSNVFLVRDDRLITPALGSDVFPGLTRSLMIKLAHEGGIVVEERAVEPGELEELDAAFLCSTLLEVQPLARIGEREMSSEGHRIVQTLRTRFREVTEA
jgi:branched-chain amino acid aminotransferase